MKQIIFTVLLAILLMSCNQVFYNTTDATTAKAMYAHYNSITDNPAVSHDFKDLNKFFKIDTKALKKISRTGDKVYFMNAAYMDSSTRVDKYGSLKNKPAVLLKVIKENSPIVYIDIRDIHYKKESETTFRSHNNKPPPSTVCPLPNECVVPDN